MKPESFETFNRIYQEQVAAVYRFWSPQMQDEIAAHNVGWATKWFDFKPYLHQSVHRYYIAYQTLCAQGEKRTICDVGGFWGIFPLTLTRLGYDVTMTEALRYYSDTFSDLFAHIAGEGVKVVDLDPFSEEAELPSRYDALFVMAVLEHYPHSLRAFLNTMRCGMAPGGMLYIEVPNIAYLPKRIEMLKGKTPCAPIRHIYESRIPFTGHHHEYTLAELRELAELADLSILAENCYNYSIQAPLWKRFARHPISTLAYRFLPDTREVLALAYAAR